MATISMSTNTNNHSTDLQYSPSLPSQEKQVDHPWSPDMALMSMPEPPKGDLDMLMESLDNYNGLSTTNTTTSEAQMFGPSLPMEENNVVISNRDPMLLHQTTQMQVSQPICDMWENINILQLLEAEEMEQEERHDGGVVTLPHVGPTLMEESRTDGLVPSLKGFPWTEVEHRMFLLGLEHHGKGNWKTIAKEFVPTRSPTQVASHAQKFFKRHSKCKPHRRPSIHDITTSHGPAPCCVRSIFHSHIYHQLLGQIPISSNYNNNMTYQHVMNMDMNINTNINMITNTYTNMYNDNNMVNMFEQVGAPDQLGQVLQPNPIEGASSSPEGLVEDYDAIEQFLAQLEVDDYLNSCGTSSTSTDFLPL